MSNERTTLMPAKRPQYGRRHRTERLKVAPSVEAGWEACARCGLPIRPGEPWDLGHVDRGSPTEYAGPEHSACNRRVLSHRKEAESAGSTSVPDADEHPAPWRSSTGIPTSRNWGGGSLTRAEWLALPDAERKRRAGS